MDKKILTGAVFLVLVVLYFLVFREKTPGEKFVSTKKLENADNGDVIRHGEPQHDKLNIAVVTALTGDASGADDAIDRGVRFAAEEINQKGGVLGKKVNIITYDFKSTSKGAAKAAQMAVSDDVSAVIGPGRSSYSLAAGPVLQENGVCMITPTASHPDVTLVGDCIFRMCFTDSFQGVLLAQFAIGKLNAKTAATIVNSHRIYSIELTKIFEKQFTKLGGTISLSAPYMESATDFSEILSQVREKNPDIIFIPSVSRDAGFIIRQARQMEIKSTFLGSDAWGEELLDFAKESAEGSFYTTFWHRDIDAPINKNFIKRYEMENAKITGDMIPLSYDALMLIAGAVNEAGSLDKKLIQKAISQTKDFIGVTGEVSFDKNGDPVNKAGVIRQFKGNQSVFYSVIQPQ